LETFKKRVNSSEQYRRKKKKKPKVVETDVDLIFGKLTKMRFIGMSKQFEKFVQNQEKGRIGYYHYRKNFNPYLKFGKRKVVVDRKKKRGLAKFQHSLGQKNSKFLKKRKGKNLRQFSCLGKVQSEKQVSVNYRSRIMDLKQGNKEVGRLFKKTTRRFSNNPVLDCNIKVHLNFKNIRTCLREKKENRKETQKLIKFDNVNRALANHYHDLQGIRKE
jgi:hypothetical protein